MKTRLSSFANQVLSNQRNKVIFYNMVAGFVIKGGALIISLLTIPAYMRYFQEEAILGLWFTMLSILTWILTFDLGIGNGLRNKLVEALSAKDDKRAKEYISSAYIIITLFAILLSVIIWIALPYINLELIFNISTNIISQDTLLLAVRISFIGILAQFVFKTIVSILYALQKTAVPNLLALITSVAQLIFIFTFNAHNSESNLIILSVVHIVCVNLPLLIATIVIFKGQLKKSKPNVRFFKINLATDVLKLGGLFFLVQIMYMALIATNEFFITHLTGPNDVVEYQIYNRIFTLPGSLFLIVLTPLWSAITKAISEQDFIWVKKLYMKLNKVVALAVVCELALIPFIQLITDLWLGSNTITINYFYSVIFSVLGGTMIWVALLSSFANGMGKLKIQGVFYTLGVVMKLIIIYFVGKVYNNWIIVILANTTILLTFCIAQNAWLIRYFKTHERMK